MRPFQLTLFLLLFSFCAFAQNNVSYEIIKDDPSQNNWLSVNLDLFQMELALPHIDAIEGASFNFGVWGHVEPGIPVGIQYSAQRSWFVLGNISNEDFSSNSEYQIGAYLHFLDRTKTKTLKVGLKTEVSDNSRGRTTTATYLPLDGKVRTQFGFRGGFISKSTPVTLEESIEGESPIYEAIKYNSLSFYGGIQLRKTTNLVVDTDRYGLASTASKSSHIFIDAILPLSSTFKDETKGGAEITESIKELIETFPLGIRIGYQVYQSEQRGVTGKLLGLSARGELGYRPYIGPYIGAGFGVTLIKASR